MTQERPEPQVTLIGAGGASADVLVAAGGEYGTLSGIALALEHGPPAVGIGSWSIARPGVWVRGHECAAQVDEGIARVRKLLGA